MGNQQNPFDSEKAKLWRKKREKSLTIFLLKSASKMGGGLLFILIIIQALRVRFDPEAFNSPLWLEGLIAEVVGALAGALVVYCWNMYKFWNRNEHYYQDYLNKG
ncbi:hypothetical protein [Thalassomonas haliotis]|uniref:Uncharacterized protein n=1 Tax=Thalassomonas haliotis TaxID=485448 RepID=A0ABY7VHC8_9GAMM|nr:hypothetical protein [Thalassomonas haliotis]WDE12338.1 hypothetical protein H3N35_02300 [Thalassomonas haliotis]